MNIFSDEGAPLMGAGGGGGSSIANLINSLANLVKTGQYITFPMSEPDGDSLGVFFWLLPFSSQDASDMSNADYSVMLFPARNKRPLEFSDDYSLASLDAFVKKYARRFQEPGDEVEEETEIVSGFKDEV